MIFFGYSDSSKKRPPHLKLRDALVHYRERFGTDPVLALMHASLVGQIADPPIPIEGRTHIPPHSIFLGHREIEA